MTTYNRRGHYRRGRNGQLVWVSGHSVTRASGQTYQSSYRSPPTSYQTPPKALPTSPARLPRSERWAKPNAICPLCGAAVYFYSNEAGSRVYFDEIGPPWPKHPCMDSVGSPAENGHLVSSSNMPSPYGFALGRHMQLKTKGIDQQKLSASRKGPYVPPTVAFTVLETVGFVGGTVLRLQRLYEKPAPELWDTFEYVSLTPGQLVFIHDGWLSYFDMSRGDVVRFWVKFRPNPIDVANTSPALEGTALLEPTNNPPVPQKKSTIFQRLWGKLAG